MTGTAPPSPPPSRRRLGCALVLAVLVIAVAGVGMTPFGGWVQSFFYGTGARFADAYVALDPDKKFVMEVNASDNSLTVRTQVAPLVRFASRWLFWMQAILDLGS